MPAIHDQGPDAIRSRITTPLLFAQWFASIALLGVIWLVQVVIYPQFADVPAEAFPPYHDRYTARVTLVVAPLMLVELVASGALPLLLFRSRLFGLALVGAALAFSLWAVTFVVQVPQHDRLARGFDAGTAAALVSGKWIRVALWTARVVVASALFLPGTRRACAR